MSERVSDVPRYAARALTCCDFPGHVVMASDYDALSRDLAAARASLDEALRLLRDVGTDGRFSLSAVNSDEADDWYDKRDALLRKVGM